MKYLDNISNTALKLKALKTKNPSVFERVKFISNLVESLCKANSTLEKLIEKNASPAKKLEAMNSVRKVADALELEVDDHYWPLPKYSEMLFVY